mgnify:CR=1 FL=1
MVRVMQQLREIYEKQSPYTFIPDETCQQARKAFDKGIECILRTQVRQNGELTVWCAQHDRITLEPCKARAYELPSLSGQESDNIVLLLMSLPHPSEKVIESIESAVKWFKKSEIKGIQKEYFTNSDGKRDYQMIPCEDCPVLWARFYELDTNRPFFSDRDGIKKYDISEIGHERRNGYSWYNKDGSKVLAKYEKWKKEGNLLLLSGISIGNHQSISFTDTLTVEQLTQDSLILKKGELVLRYSKTNEIPDEEAIPTPDTPTQKLLSVKGKLIIGHETRSFTSEGDSTDYWIVDKTGELLQKYDGETKGIKNGTPVYVLSLIHI